MKVVIALTLVTFVAVASAAILKDVPSEYIDYNTCDWMYRGGGDVITCPTGFVAVGACGNKGQNRCSGKAHGLQCCRMKQGGN